MNKYFIIILFIFLFFIYKRDNKCLKPKFNPYIWNRKDIRKNNNCYSYAIRNLKKNRKSKLQPGNIAKIPEIKKINYNCNDLIKNVLNDNKDIFKINSEQKCPCNYYKIALFLDKSEPNKDYHFYRQDNNLLWSHKPGNKKATNLDASNNLIKNPEYADRNYIYTKNKNNYTDFCSYFCVPYNN